MKRKINFRHNLRFTSPKRNPFTLGNKISRTSEGRKSMMNLYKGPRISVHHNKSTPLGILRNKTTKLNQDGLNMVKKQSVDDI